MRYLDGTGLSKLWSLIKSKVSEASSLAEAAQDTADSALTTANSKAPTSHASSATTYGVGTSSLYGHVKLYSSTGTSTDGAMTRAAVTTALASYATQSSLSEYATQSWVEEQGYSSLTQLYSGALTATSATVSGLSGKTLITIVVQCNVNNVACRAVISAVSLNSIICGSAMLVGANGASGCIASVYFTLSSNTITSQLEAVAEVRQVMADQYDTEATIGTPSIVAIYGA